MNRTILFALVCSVTSLVGQGEPSVVLGTPGVPLRVVFQNLPPASADALKVDFLPLLERLSGSSAEVTALAGDGEPPAGTLVFRQIDDPHAPEDAFRIRTIAGRVEISATAPIGLRFGFYEFMERLGCRFWAWDAEDIPSSPNLKIEAIDYAWNPPFRLHDQMNREAMTRKNDFVHKIRAVSPIQFTGGHNIQPLLRSFAEANSKEVFPLVKLRDPQTKEVTKEIRGFNNLHYCYTANGIAEALAAELEKEVVKRGGDLKHFIYFAGMGDWYNGMCECERCEKIYAEEAWTNPDGRVLPGYSATLLRMINKTAEILDAKYPGIQVGTFAYMSLEAPPAITVPRENVSIYVPRLRHSANTAANDPSSENRAFWLNLTRWCEVAKNRVYVWEYGASFHNFVHPYPVIPFLARSIKAYHDLGIRGLMIQGNYSSMGGDAVVMKNWVFSKLMSDPSLDPQKLILEFTDGYYGPAGPAVREYLKTLDAAAKFPEMANYHEFSDPLATYLKPEVITALSASIAAAEAAVSDPAHAEFLTRVQDLRFGVEAARLWKTGPLKEKEGRYIRTDFGTDTFPDALRLVSSNRRGTGISEYSTGRAKWMDFLARHGGPVATLTDGDLKVRVWPADKGAIGLVLVGHIPVIQRTWDDALRFTEFEGEPDTKSAVLFGDAGVGAWSPDTKQVFSQAIELLNNRKLKVVYSLRGVAPKALSAIHDIHTSYPVKSAASDLKLSYRDTSGAWQDIEARPGMGSKTPIAFAGVTGWRISSRRFTLTDELEIHTPSTAAPLDPKRPHLTGMLISGDDGNLSTINVIQADEVTADEQRSTVTRSISIELAP